MNILVNANHFAVCSGRYISDALVRLGHTVVHIGRPMGRDIWGIQVPEEYVWEPDEMFNQQEIDLAIVADSDQTALNFAESFRQYLKPETPLVVWGVDNHVRDYRRPYFDHYFLAHKSVSVMPDVLEGTGVFMPGNLMPHNEDIDRWELDYTWLPCAYDPVRFPPSPIPWEQRQYDVCMIGVMYPKRWELVNVMRAAGLKVLAGTGLVYDAYRDAYHNSRVALVSSYNGDLPIRLFEGAGMGCAVLCDRIQDLNQFELSPAIRSFLNDDAVEAVRTFLRTTDHFDFPTLAYEWAKPHTWDARAQVVIDWMEARS